jgi:hypothetical protein
MIERIDKMEWLDVIETMTKGHPDIDDVDLYLNYVSKWPLFVHLVSAALCLGMSAVFHLFFVYSPEACLLLSKLDYTGITILIFGSTVPGIQYMFACSAVSRKFPFLNSSHLLFRPQTDLHVCCWCPLCARLYSIPRPSFLKGRIQIGERSIVLVSWSLSEHPSYVPKNLFVSYLIVLMRLF